MNAVLRVVAPEPSLGLALSGMWDSELERNILGAAMIGEPMPSTLEPRHFFPSQHQRIYEAVQSVGGNVAKVNVWLRESSSKFGPPVAKAVELAEMCIEARWALDQGWALDFPKLLELHKRRALLECMTRQALLLRAGEAEHSDVYQALREHFRSSK